MGMRVVVGMIAWVVRRPSSALVRWGPDETVVLSHTALLADDAFLVAAVNEIDELLVALVLIHLPAAVFFASRRTRIFSPDLWTSCHPIPTMAAWKELLPKVTPSYVLQKLSAAWTMCFRVAIWPESQHLLTLVLGLEKSGDSVRSAVGVAVFVGNQPPPDCVEPSAEFVGEPPLPGRVVLPGEFVGEPPPEFVGDPPPSGESSPSESGLSSG
jgi:hypothetical protein